MNLFEDLKWRGLIKDVAGDNIEDIINGDPFSFYWGTDPTADSLHLGHYSSLVTAKRLAKFGHKPILLVGGATGLIGDPRPTAEREIISKEVLDGYFKCLKIQVNELLDGKATIVNNYDWFKGIEFIEFLRDVGKYINVNYMLNKDTIKSRMDTGITYAEFSYTLMQGFDYVHLYENHNCIMQCAGSDQWGNITTGIELIKKKLGKTAYGFTMPLILDKTGKKFGKSEGNALWLDKNKTSSYELYQYLINVDDSLISHYLKVFTFLTKEEILDIEARHNEKPEARIGQKALAKELITDVRGSEEFEKAKMISESLFSEDIKKLSATDIIEGFKGVKTVEINNEVVMIDLLVDNGICSSRREAREMLGNNAISINNEKINDENLMINKDLFIEGRVLVLRKGKKNQYLVMYK